MVSSVLQRSLGVGLKEKITLCSAYIDEQESTHIQAIHRSRNPSVKRTLCFVRPIHSVVSKVVGECKVYQSIDPTPVHRKAGGLHVRENWSRVGIDITHYKTRNYLTLIDSGPSWFSVLRHLPNQDAANVFRQMEPDSI